MDINWFKAVDSIFIRFQNRFRFDCTDWAKTGSIVWKFKVLTFTIETEPGEVPDPVDLNPNDEWADMGDGEIGSSGGKTDYVWDDM